MKIYTRTGDAGETGLFGGERVSKADARVEAYGTVDETNAALGVARSAGLPKTVHSVLEAVQHDLFVLGAELACAPGKEDRLGMELIGDDAIQRLERAIDTAEGGLSPLKSFVSAGRQPGRSGTARSSNRLPTS